MGLPPIHLTRYQALGPFDEANLGPEEKFGHLCSPLGWELVEHSLDLEASTSRSLCCSSLREDARFLDQSSVLSVSPVLQYHLDPRTRRMPPHRPI